MKGNGDLLVGAIIGRPIGDMFVVAIIGRPIRRYVMDEKRRVGDGAPTSHNSHFSIAFATAPIKWSRSRSGKRRVGVGALDNP